MLGSGISGMSSFPEGYKEIICRRNRLCFVENWNKVNSEREELCLRVFLDWLVLFYFFKLILIKEKTT